MYPLVLMSDFGCREHYVASMKGVALGVHPALQIYDLTHDIKPFDIWEASITLSNTIEYWPPGTVFVSVIDPGVGTGRKSLIARIASGQFIVCPDNGLLTFVVEKTGIDRIRLLDDTLNRRPGSEGLHTFHGRDVYSWAGAKLAAGQLKFDEAGPEFPGNPVMLDHQKAVIRGGTLSGTVLKTEEPFGNLVTNIPGGMLGRLAGDESIVQSFVAGPLEQFTGLKPGITFTVTIYEHDAPRFNESMPFLKSYGYAEPSRAFLYIDSSGMVGLARDRERFSRVQEIRGGSGWTMTITP